jgi:acid phosphatase (class A)
MRLALGWFRLVTSIALVGAVSNAQAVRGNGGTPARAFYVQVEGMADMPFEPPPSRDSPIGRADLATLAHWRSHRTQADLDRANQSFFIDFRTFWGTECPFQEPLPQEVQAFFDRIDGNIGALARTMKDRFMRPRPDQGDGFADGGGKKRGSGYSYPSTHAAISRTFALVLGDLVPLRKSEFLAKADGIAQDRVILGVHYPSDLVAGKHLADLFHHRLVQSRDYHSDLERVRHFLQAPVTGQGAKIVH